MGFDHTMALDPEPHPLHLTPYTLHSTPCTQVWLLGETMCTSPNSFQSDDPLDPDRRVFVKKICCRFDHTIALMTDGTVTGSMMCFLEMEMANLVLRRLNPNP